MKFNIKTMIIVSGFLGMSGLFASTPAPVDPDAAVYNAILGLGFSISTDGKTVTLPAALTGPSVLPADAIWNTYIGPTGVLSNALAYYTADGKTAPASTATSTTASTPLLTYYNSVNAIYAAVNNQQSALASLVNAETSAKTDLQAANAATDLTTFNTKLGSTNISGQAAWLASNDTADVTTLYGKIVSAYNATASQSATGLSAYVTSLNTLLSTAGKLPTLFSPTQNTSITNMSTNLTTNLSAANISALTAAAPTASTVSTYLTTPANATAARALRTYLATPAK